MLSVKYGTQEDKERSPIVTLFLMFYKLLYWSSSR